MARNAYLITTDLHLHHKNLRSRIDYRQETVTVLEKLIEIAAEYQRDGYNVTLILLGDVFHGSYGNDIFHACNDNNFFFMWKKRFGQIYSLIGNHELSFYDKNPFYTLVTEIESPSVRTIMNRVYQPAGSLDVIQVVDRIEDGDTVFVCNHYGTRVQQPEDGKHNIGLFHQNLASSEIIQNAQNRYGFSWFADAVEVEKTGVFSGYEYCFLGHAHTLYGTFRTDDGTILCYLGSLGRTTVNEVQDNFLERNVPVVCIEDGRLVSVLDNKFMLPDRASCVIEEQVKLNQQVTELRKEQRIIRQSLSADDNPVNNVLSLLANDAMAHKIFTDLLSESVDSYGQELNTSMQEALQRYLI